jgi:hypothetical protein
MASLPVLEVTQQRLDEWGKSSCICAVCTCDLEIGDQVQVIWREARERMRIAGGDQVSCE